MFIRDKHRFGESGIESTQQMIRILGTMQRKMKMSKEDLE